MRSPVDEPIPPVAESDAIRHLKDSLRRRMTALREGTPAGRREGWSAAARVRIAALRCWREARTVALFAAIRGEVDLLPLVTDAIAEGRRVVFPRADRATRTLAFHAVASPGDLAPGAFGVPEPPGDPGSLVASSGVDLLLVPGVVFDARGGRLGFGGGFYDRLLASLSPAPPGPRLFAVGVAFECQVVAEVPMESTDRRVDALVTEAQSVLCGERGRLDRIL